MSLTSKLSTLNLKNKRVFLRADLNIPIADNRILSDFKLRKILPTLDYLIAQNCRVILATHMGRPKNCEPALSTKQLLNWFKENNYNIIFESNLEQAEKKAGELAGGEILLLENMRFFPGEQSTDSSCRTQFAHELYKLGEIYITDAFGDLHRSDSSIVELPKLYPADKKTFGFLVEQELTVLTRLKKNPSRPFVLVIGGGKVKDKLPLIDSLLEHVSTILLGPATVFTFMAAQNHQTGTSLVEPELYEQAKKILAHAKQKNVRVLFPVDYYIEQENNYNEQNLKLILAQDFLPDMKGITIGPQTVELFAREINHAHTLFLNGAMGFENKPETMEQFNTLLKIIAESESFSVVGGGESVAAVYNLQIETDISFCSTGGGATLYFLTGKPLPGLEALV